MADINNSRIRRFIPINRNGTTVISIEGLTNFIMGQEYGYRITITFY